MDDNNNLLAKDYKEIREKVYIIEEENKNLKEEVYNLQEKIEFLEKKLQKTKIETHLKNIISEAEFIKNILDEERTEEKDILNQEKTEEKHISIQEKITKESKLISHPPLTTEEKNKKLRELLKKSINNK